MAVNMFFHIKLEELKDEKKSIRAYFMKTCNEILLVFKWIPQYCFSSVLVKRA